DDPLLLAASGQECAGDATRAESAEQELSADDEHDIWSIVGFSRTGDTVFAQFAGARLASCYVFSESDGDAVVLRPQVPDSSPPRFAGTLRVERRHLRKFVNSRAEWRRKRSQTGEDKIPR